MTRSKPKHFFPIFLLLLAALTFSGGCGGGSGGGGDGGSGDGTKKILSAVPASPNTVNLESYASNIEWLTGVDVALSISVSEPVDELLCVLHLVSGDVAYDAETYLVTADFPAAEKTGAEEPESWVATALIEHLTPDRTEYVATFNVLDAMEDAVSEQFAEGVRMSAVFHIDENMDDQDHPVYYYVGSVTTPEPNPETFFGIDVKSVQIDSPYFLPENERETVYDPSNPSFAAASSHTYLGIPVTIKLDPRNSAVTAITIRSQSGAGNILFGGSGIQNAVKTTLLPFDTESAGEDMEKILWGEASSLPLSPDVMEFRPAEDEAAFEVRTFTKRGLEEGEFLGVSFLLGVQINGSSISPGEVLEYLSGENAAAELNVPIIVEAVYEPENAVSDSQYADGVAWTSRTSTVVYDPSGLFAEDLRLLFESQFAMHELSNDYVPAEDPEERAENRASSGGIFARASKTDDIDHYDKPAPSYIWDFNKSFNTSSGNPKYFSTGIDVGGKIYVRAFGAGLKVTGKAPVTILNNQNYLFDITGNAFVGNQSLTIPPFENAASAAKMAVKVFGVNIYEEEWPLSQNNNRNKGRFSVVKETQFTKRFWEFLIPLALRAGARGEMGVKPDIVFQSLENISFSIVPYVDASAFAAVELDVWVFRAGISAVLKLLGYEFVPKATFGLAFKSGETVDGRATASGIQTKLDFAIDHTISSLDGALRLFFDRRKYYVWGKWVHAATYNLLDWHGLRNSWNIYKGTILNKTLWLPKL